MRVADDVVIINEEGSDDGSEESDVLEVPHAAKTHIKGVDTHLDDEHLEGVHSHFRDIVDREMEAGQLQFEYRIFKGRKIHPVAKAFVYSEIFGPPRMKKRFQ